MTGRYSAENPNIKLIRRLAWWDGVNKAVLKKFLQKYRNGEAGAISEKDVRSALNKLQLGQLKNERRKDERREYIRERSIGEFDPSTVGQYSSGQFGRDSDFDYGRRRESGQNQNSTGDHRSGYG